MGFKLKKEGSHFKNLSGRYQVVYYVSRKLRDFLNLFSDLEWSYRGAVHKKLLQSGRGLFVHRGDISVKGR